MSIPRAVAIIVEGVATEHGLTPRQLYSGARRRDIAHARFECWSRLRSELRFVSGPPSLPQIGKWFDRHHTTILSGLNRAKEIDCSAPRRVEARP